MSDPSNPIKNNFVETSFSEWRANNPYEDKVESLGRYTEHLRNEYLEAGRYDEVVESQLQTNLSKGLQANQLVTQENVDQINQQLKSFRKPDLLTSVNTLLDGDPINDEFLDDRQKQILTRFQKEKELGQQGDVATVGEIVREANREKYTSLYKSGEILAAVIEDEEGNEIFLGGQIPENMTEADVLKKTSQYGVSASNLFDLRFKREVMPENNGLMRYEVQKRQMADFEVRELLANSEDLSVKASLYALAKEYADDKTWDWGDKFNYWASDGLQDLLRGVTTFFSSGEKKKEGQKAIVLDKLREKYDDETEENKQRLRAFIQSKTDYSSDVIDDVINDVTIKYAFGGDAKENVNPFTKYTDNEDEQDKNVHRTRYSGTLVAADLILSPTEFSKALSQAGVTGRAAAIAEKERELAVIRDYDRMSEILLKEESTSEEYQKAIIEGKQKGLTNSQIIEGFRKTHDFGKIAHRFSGVGSSIIEGFQSIGYGLAAAGLGSEQWGQEGLKRISENNAHDRAVAQIFGMEMGAGQDFMEAIAPMMTDAALTALLTAGTAKVGAWGGAAYITAKSSGTAAARSLIMSTARQALATVGKETAEEAAERLLKSTAMKGASRDATFTAVKAYNSKLAKRLNIGAASFIPAATRSGSNTYGVIFQTVEDDLTLKHKTEEGWEEGWSLERVKEEAHDAAIGGAITQGTITGLLTAGFGMIGRGGLEEAFMRGMSFRQMKQITSNVMGRNLGNATFQKIMNAAITKVKKVHRLEAPKGFLRSALDEGIEEGVDEFINTLTVDAFTNQETSLFDRMSQAWHGFVLGAALGGSGNLVSKTAKNIAPKRFLDRAAAARVERDVFKEYEREVEAQGLGEKLREAGSPATAQEAERLIRQYKRAERPEKTATLEPTRSAVEEVEDEIDSIIEEEGDELSDAEMDEINAELATLVTPEAVRKEMQKITADDLQSTQVDPDAASNPAIEVAQQAEGGSTSAAVYLSSQHAAKNTQLELEEEHSLILDDIRYKEQLYRKMERELQGKEGVSADRLRKALDDAVANGKALSPQDAKFMRAEASKRFKEKQNEQAASDKKGSSEEDIKSIEDLVKAGFPHTLTIDQLERLGIATDNLDKASLRTLTKELRQKIEKEYPVIKEFDDVAATLPSIYGAKGKVRISSSGMGVFDNNPITMLTLLESNIQIPIPQDVVDGGKINPAFETERRGGQTFVTDIMVRESGGMVSAKTAFNKVGALEEDYSRVADAATKLNELKGDVQISEDIKVRNPFNTKSKIKLTTLLDRVKDTTLLQAILEVNSPDFVKLTQGFRQSALVTSSVEMQAAIYEYAQKVSSGVEVESSPFKVAEVAKPTATYFFNQQVARKKRAARSLVSLVSDSEFNSDTVAPIPDTYVPVDPNPLPPLPTRKVTNYIEDLQAAGGDALDNNNQLRGSIANLLNSEYHRGTNRAFVLRSPQLFTEFLQYMSKGNYARSKAAKAFQTNLNNGLFEAEGDVVRKVLRTLSLSDAEVELPIDQDPEFLQQLKADLQDLAGADYTVTDGQVLAFHVDLAKAGAEAKFQRGIQNGRSMRVNAGVNDAILEALGISSNDPEGVIEALEKVVGGKSQTQSTIAKVLLADKEFIRSIKFSFEATTADYAGAYYLDNEGNPNIVINGARASDRGVVDVLLHELVHAFSDRVLSKSPEVRTSSENNAINRIESLLKILRKRAASENAPDSVLYGLKNIDDFLSTFLTSPEFQGFVKSMRTSSGERNFIQRIIDAIANLFSRSNKRFQQALQDSLTLTQRRGISEPETAEGFASQIASKLSRRQGTRSRLATSIGMAEDINTNEALDNAAVEYFAFAANYVPPEINIVMDNTTDVIAEWDAESQSIVFNGRRAAAKVNQLVAAVDGRPIRREHILAAILNEEIAHVASFAQLSQDQIEALMAGINDLDAQSIIEQYYPEAEREAALARFRSEDPEISRTERFILAEEQLRIHVQKVLRGAETNEQVNFLLENPSLLQTVKQYFKNVLTKLTYRRNLKDVSPEMRDAVNRVVTEVRAMEMAYRLSPNGMHFDIENSEATMNQMLKQLEMHNSITPPEEDIDEEAPPAPTLQSRWGADAGTVPSDHGAVGKLANGESIGNFTALPAEILADAKDPNKTVNVTLSHTNITLGRRSRESEEDLQNFPLGVMPFSLEIGGAKYNAFNVRMKNAGVPNLDETIYKNFLSKKSAAKYQLSENMKLKDVLDRINTVAKRTGVTSAINMTDIKLTNPELKNKSPNSLIPKDTVIYAQGPKNVIGGPTGELVSANEDIDVSDMMEGWDALAYNPAMGNYMYRVAEDSAGRTRFYTQSKFVGADEMVMVSNLDTGGTNPFQNFAIWVKGARYKAVDPQENPPAHKTIKELIDKKQADPTPLKPSLQSRVGSDIDLGLTMKSFKVNSYPKELDLFKTKAGKVKGAPPQVKSSQDVTKVMNRLKKLTIEGAVGRYWYEDAASKILEITKGDVVEAEKFIALLAIYSPQTGVEVNTYFAVRAYEQHANGVSREDFGVKTSVQDDKARAVLYDIQPWDGRKTDNFYKNLMFHIVSEASPDQLDAMQIDPAFLKELQQPVTVDMWVYRALGYDTIGLTDAKGQGAFGFSEKLINRLAYALNQNLPEGADPYQAHQIQAMIWTAIKARSEQKDVKKKTEAQSVKAGDLVYKTDAKGKRTRSFPTKEAERKHQLRWTKNALAAEGVDFIEASRSFDYFVNTMGMTATWEVIPSTLTDIGKQLAAMSFDEKRAFTQKAMGLIVDPETGEDLLARELGISLSTVAGSAGGYAGGVTPNVISTVYPNKPSGTYDDDAIRAYSRALQFIFKQDAVPWSRLIKTTKEDLHYKVVNENGRTIRKFDSQGAAEDYAAKAKKDYTVAGGEQSFGINLAFNEELTESKLQEIQDYLSSVNSDLGFTQISDNEVIVVNYKMDYNNMLPVLTDEDFNDKIIERYGQETKQTYFTTVGEYGYHDWSDDSEGATIFQTSPRFTSDVQAWVRDRRERFQQIGPEAPVTPRLQSRYGAGSLIPKELDANSVDFSNWIEMLELPLMEVGTYKSPSSMFGRLMLGYADRDIMRFKEERDAFVREAKKLVEDFKEKHDRVIKEAAKKGIDIPPELISRASGSNMGSQLTDEQLQEVEDQFNKERANANRTAKTPKQREVLLDIAEKNKVKNATSLRKKNREVLLADRNQALKDLLTISPEAHKLVLDMRKLTDELSNIGNELFSGFINNDDFRATFDANGGIYITRRYRMFEDNDFMAQVRDFEDPTYAQERQDAINYFAQQYIDFHVAEKMTKEGLSKSEARANVELELEEKNSSARTKGKDMMMEFLNAYEKNAVGRELEVYQSADGGRSIMFNERKFKGGPLKAIANELNAKQNVPAPLRKLLGEYGDKAGIDNLAHTVVHTASVMANQAFFNRVVEHGTKGDNPWLVSEEEIAKDLELPLDQQKYVGWSKLKADEGKMDWNPIKGYYTKPEIIKDFRQLININKAESAAKEIDNPTEYLTHTALRFLHRATGLSLAAKTLGSVGFYVRNMLGNAMFFGPMQGYYGGIGKAFGEMGGVGKSILSGDAANSKSMIVRAALGSKAAMDAELTVLSSMNVWGDEMEANALRDLLIGKTTIPQMENKISELAKFASDKTKGAKEGYEKAVNTATRLASAMDAYYKIGLYELELETIRDAAKADPEGGQFSRMLERDSRGAVVLDEDGEPKITIAMKRAAAVKVKKVSQSYSQAPPIIKGLTRSSVGLLIAPYVRFAAEIPRVMINTRNLLKEEREQGKTNPVMRKRYMKRLKGMIGTMSFTFILPKVLQLAIAGIGEDEDEALRKGMPSYLRGHTFFYIPTGEDELYSLDLTYLNPFSVVADPIARSFETFWDRGKLRPIDATKELIVGLLRPYVSEQILAGAVKDLIENKNQYGNAIRYGDDDVANFFRSFGYVWEKVYEPRSFNKLRQAITAAQGDKPATDFISNPLGLLLSELLPVKPHKIDLQNSFRTYLRDHTNEYRELNTKFNRLLSDKSMTDGQIRDLFDDIYKTRLGYNNEFRRVMRGYNSLGLSWNTIQAQAKQKGVSKERLTLTHNGYMNRPVLSKFMLDKLRADKTLEQRAIKFFNYSQKFDRYPSLED